MPQNDLVLSHSATGPSAGESRPTRRPQDIHKTPTRRLLTVEISPELSARWVRACEKNVAKQHGALTTVANVALARAKQRMNGGKQAMEAASLNFVCEYPVSRRCMTVSFW